MTEGDEGCSATWGCLSALLPHGLARDPGGATPFVELHDQPQDQGNGHGHKHGEQQDAKRHRKFSDQ